MLENLSFDFFSDFWLALSSAELRSSTWGLFTRAMGLVYLICLGSLLPQVGALVGRRGIMPIADQLEHIGRHLPWYRAFALTPSLLWLVVKWSRRSNFSLYLLVGSGMAAGVGIIWGGQHSPYLFMWAWWVLLSLQHGLRMHYPWDTALLESGFLAMFLPATLTLPEWAATQPPPTLLVFAFHFLVFRILIGFGKTKFFGIGRHDWLYTRDFLLNMPIVTPVGWRVAMCAPAWVHKGMLLGVALVELVAPWFLLFPGPTRLMAAGLIFVQMLGIQLTGNFGYFNLLSCVLCMTALDTSSSLAALSWGELLAPEHLLFTIAFSFIALASPAYLAVNSWATYGFLDWPAWQRLRPGCLKIYLALLRCLAPLRIINGYGVFHARSAPPIHWVPVIEGSDDGVCWHAFEYRYTMTHGHSRPRFVAPHHPRLDHLAFYEAVGVDGSGYLSVLSFSDPYRHTRVCMLDLAVQRLVERGSVMPRLLGSHPSALLPPKMARVSMFRATPASRSEFVASGRRWQVERVGEHVAPSGGESHVYEAWLPPPELYHFEAVRWRKRALECEAVSRAGYESFWQEFLPFVHDAHRRARQGGIIPEGSIVAGRSAGCSGSSATPPWSWIHVPAIAVELRRRYTPRQLRAFQRTMGKLTTVALARLDAVFSRPARNFARDVIGLPMGAASPRYDQLPESADAETRLQCLAAWPHGPLRSWFRLGAAIQYTMLVDGEAGWKQFAGPGFQCGKKISTRCHLNPGGRRSMAAAAAELGLDLGALERVARGLTLDAGLFLESVVNYDQIAQFAVRMRILYSFDAFEPLPTGLIPGVFELVGQVLRYPQLGPIHGWGDQARLQAVSPLPRMMYDAAEHAWTQVETPGVDTTTGEPSSQLMSDFARGLGADEPG